MCIHKCTVYTVVVNQPEIVATNTLETNMQTTDKNEQLLIEVGCPEKGHGEPVVLAGGQGVRPPVKAVPSWVDQVGLADPLHGRPQPEEQAKGSQRRQASSYGRVFHQLVSLLLAAVYERWVGVQLVAV